MIVLILIASLISGKYFFEQGFDEGLKHNNEKGNCLYLGEGDKSLAEHDTTAYYDEKGAWFCIEEEVSSHSSPK